MGQFSCGFGILGWFSLFGSGFSNLVFWYLVLVSCLFDGIVVWVVLDLIWVCDTLCFLSGVDVWVDI